MTDTALYPTYMRDDVHTDDGTPNVVLPHEWAHDEQDTAPVALDCLSVHPCADSDSPVLCHAQLLLIGMQTWVARQLARPLPALLLVTTSSIVWTAVFLMMFILVDFEPVLGLVMASSFAMLLTLVVAVTSMNAQGDD